jgi:chromosome segregation ATPase
VNTFALLTVMHVVEPGSEQIFGTKGFHETLLALCAPEADPNTRFFASRLLLLAYREGTMPAPPEPALGHLCSCLAINFQAKYEFDLVQHELLESAVAQASQWSLATASSDGLLQQATSDAAHLRSEAGQWNTSVSAAGESTDLTVRMKDQVAEALATFTFTLDTAAASIGDGSQSAEEAELYEELRAREAILAHHEHDLEENEQLVQALAEERNAVLQSIAEKDEVAWKLEANMTEATENAQEAASLGTPPGFAMLMNDHKMRYAETKESISELRGQAELLDHRLSEMCEPIPGCKAEVECARRTVEELKCRCSALGQGSLAIDTWGSIFDRQKECSSELETVRRSLRDVRGCVMSERERRRVLRASVQSLVQSLMQLDGHLESLESWDALDAEGGFLSLD